MDFSQPPIGEFDFSIPHLAYVMGGILIGVSLMRITWATIMYVSAKRDETEWDEARPVFMGGSVTIMLVFLVWAVSHMLW